MKITHVISFLVIFAMVVFPVFAESKIYRYTDKNGGLHFTDNPVEVPADQLPKMDNERKKPVSPEEVRHYLREGGVAYLMKHYQRAIQLYSKILEFEKKQQTLTKNDWRMTVENLGMSYNAIGDNEKAREIFEYGLSKDNEYPMFYYNLAGAYARMDDLENSIENLKLAFKYRANMMPGEQFPNPAYDNSFSRFKNNYKFEKILKELWR